MGFPQREEMRSSIRKKRSSTLFLSSGVFTTTNKSTSLEGPSVFSYMLPKRAILRISLFKKDCHDLLSNAVQLSGYESLMLEIAMRIYINSKNKLQKINFFIIDEGFSFCDEKSLQKVENLFIYLRKLYDFTIVVSHSEQIKLYTDVDLTISHKNGVSSVNNICEKSHINKNLFLKLSGCQEKEKEKDKIDFKSLNKKNNKKKNQVSEDESD